MAICCLVFSPRAITPIFCGSPAIGAMDGVVLLVTGEAFGIGYCSPHICSEGKI